ncbi:WD repeat-containing protein 3-like [Homarus americanus]|uniref:WD repeat-containing protein 3-like n=1 Tax=Homarus americanus TaxID=6706 RepID=UPI001C496CD0|nr:WD repeat-containing protein 3-like [Homarus americanus]XP_042222100.1 WD repeat-containing protein 3-like [Homarus americanus]
MGLTTQYLRYVPGSVFGLVGSSRCVRFVTRFSQTAKYVAVPACQHVLIWDTRRAIKVLTLDAGVCASVTVVEPRPPSSGSLDNTHIAVGYSDGSVAVFDLRVGQPLKFNGHRSAVSALSWDPQGMRVASGSNDGEIVIWDVVSERGMVRLKGHKGKITRLRFLLNHNVIVSSCRDSFIKFWDVDVNHCFRTLTGHRAEVWDFVLLKNDTRLVSGSSDAELRVWSLRFTDTDNKVKKDRDEEKIDEPPNKMFHIDTEGTHAASGVDQDDQIDDDDASILEIVKLGSVLRSRGDRVCGLLTDGRVVACHGKTPVVDLFIILTEEEVEAKVSKRLKKARKRARESGSAVIGSETTQLTDEIKKLPTLRAANKLLGLDILSERLGTIKMVTLHIDNTLAVYESYLDAKEDKGQTLDKNKGTSNIIQHKQLSLLDRPGHRTEVRAVAFNSLSDQLVTASADSLKVWHRGDTQAITTVLCDYAVSLIVVPGDRHALIGTRSGRLQLFDLGSSAQLEDIMAHEPNEMDTDTGVWSVALTHDGRGFVTGGSDKMVKFWKFELVRDDGEGQGKRLSFVQDSRALKVADQVTCVRCSSNGRFLAVATLDLKETLYFSDTLKLCHELYGKALPATCMDFSTDGTMIVTGSKDTSLRIYGTDFGDQRRLLKNAHQGGVTDLRFIPKTHMFFSCGQDGSVKQWDADNFQRIVTLEGHTGIVRCLAVCPKGAWVATGGQDRSIRLWERTQEPLVLEEEREEERQKEEEKGGGTTATQRPVVPGEEGAQAVRPSMTSHHTEQAADMILEALMIYREQIEAGSLAVPHQLMTYVYHTSDPLKFVLEVLRKVKSSELEEAVILLPLDRILELLVVIKGLLEHDWDVELASRILVLAVRINLPQLLASAKAAPIIHALAYLLPKKTLQLQDMVGFNLAGLRHMKDRIEQRSETQLFAEASQKVKEARRKRKKKERAVKRVLMTI